MTRVKRCLRERTSKAGTHAGDKKRFAHDVSLLKVVAF
jgi:hypothetical protein